MRARYYDPSTGQFISTDPAVATTREPYGYVYDNPLNLTDPSGLWTIGGCIGAGFTFGALHVSANACVVTDFHSVKVTRTALVGPGAGAAIGFAGTVQVSNADRIDDLRGGFATAGGSVGELACANFDAFRGNDRFGRDTVRGFNLGGGGCVGVVPVEVHGGESFTDIEPDRNKGSPSESTLCDQGLLRDT